MHGWFGDQFEDSQRVANLSDGVFAIAMTLLAFNIRIPDVQHVPRGELGKALAQLWPHFMIYVFTFVILAVFWMAHHRVFRHIRRYDTPLMWLNAFFLLCVSFLPFPSALAGEYEEHHIAVVFYSVSMAFTSLVLGAVLWYATSRPGFLHDHLDPTEVRQQLRLGLLCPAVFLLSAGLAYVHLGLARASWLLVFPLIPLVSRFVPSPDHRHPGSRGDSDSPAA